LTTVITQGLAAAVGLGSLFSGRYGIHLVPADLWPDPAMQWRLIKLGFPAAIEQSTRALGLLLMTILVSGFGTVTLAAYRVGTRILSFAIFPHWGCRRQHRLWLARMWAPENRTVPRIPLGQVAISG